MRIYIYEEIYKPKEITIGEIYNIQIYMYTEDIYMKKHIHKKKDIHIDKNIYKVDIDIERYTYKRDIYKKTLYKLIKSHLNKYKVSLYKDLYIDI